MELEGDIANMDKLVKESDKKFRELEAVHDLFLDKVESIKEQARRLGFHDMWMKEAEKESV
jgi:hypothetical protein